jgi:hypothetical protein
MWLVVAGSRNSLAICEANMKHNSRHIFRGSVVADKTPGI